MSLYSDVKDSGGFIANHASDLYIEVNPENTALLEKHGKESHATTFTDQVTGKLCYDVPFAYDPFWIEANNRPAWPKLGS